MCGINGFNWQDENLIKKMNTKIAHRGPDDGGLFVDERISLGHRRLSIIDLSEAGHQPMITADGRYAIVYNGELYNYKELKKEIDDFGYNFCSSSDTEVVLAMYKFYGAGMLPRMNGIFALAIWDNEKKELFLARDRFGVKPLYYYLKDGKFIFSSEAKAILSCVPAGGELDVNSLNKYLRFLYVLGPETMWRSINKLLPGHFALLRGKDLIVRAYFDFKFEKQPRAREELKPLILETLRGAVRRQLISDRPVGLFLSGGIDSSALCAMMAAENAGPVKTFSVGFDTAIEPQKFNADFQVAAKTAAYFHTEHTPIVISDKDMADNFEKCVIAMDEPVSNHIQVATYLLAQEAKKSVAVVLGGDGGDETFGGYDRYYLMNKIRQAQYFFPILKNKKFGQWLGSASGSRELFLKIGIKSDFDLFISFMSQKEEALSGFLNPEYNIKSAIRPGYGDCFAGPHDDCINNMLLADLKTWLVDESLIRSDKLTMAHGLEQRVPFLDNEMVELAFSIGSEFKLDTRERGKKILTEALGGILPAFVLEQKKRGFFSPAAKWLRGPHLGKLAYEILSPDYCAKSRDLFNWKEVNEILENHINKKSYALNTIWSLLTFQVWARNFL